MSTKITRGSVSYTIPDAPGTDTHPDRSWYKTIIDIMLTNLNELDSLDTQAANEEKKKKDNSVPKTKQLNGITDTKTKKELEDARSSILTSDAPLFASDVNSIANNLNKIYKRAKNATNNPAATVSAKEVVTASKMQTFISTCIEISQALDPKATPIWNGDGSCKTSCETQCQVLCMLKCQAVCQLSCQSKCELSCQSKCQLTCQATCQLTCQATCEKGCQATCQLSCQETCQLRCQSGCQLACQDRCETSCQIGCQTSCQNKCEISCQVGCQLSCQAKCETACQTTCQTSCQTKCETSCQSACMLACQSCHGGTCHDQHCGGW